MQDSNFKIGFSRYSIFEKRTFSVSTNSLFSSIRMTYKKLLMSGFELGPCGDVLDSAACQPCPQPLPFLPKYFVTITSLEKFLWSAPMLHMSISVSESSLRSKHSMVLLYSSTVCPNGVLVLGPNKYPKRYLFVCLYKHILVWGPGPPVANLINILSS